MYNNRMSQVVVYVHGFGVKKDSRGFFTQLSLSLPKAKHVFIDLNTFDDKTNELFVADLEAQTKKLQAAFSVVLQKNPNATYDLVCHSQGCLVAGLANLSPIRKIMLLAPPSELNANDMSGIFSDRPGSHIDINGESRLSRRDGSTTVVAPEYWKSIENLDIIGMFNRLAINSQVFLVEAAEDEVVGKTDFRNLVSQIEVTMLPGDHNYSGVARRSIIEFVAGILADTST